MSGRVIGEAEQSYPGLTTDVQSVHEKARQLEGHLMVILSASRHVQYQRQVHRTPAF